jgi:hypothetical protein
MAEDRSTEPRNIKISATDDENYPDYELEFDGDLVVVQGSHITEPITIRGPHSFQLPSVAQGVDVKVVVTHKDADPGIPNLRITIRRRGPNAR